ncbi:hypothetical protein [Nostoc sp. MG11]|uniref:hypothetical protein n=1 Tax=Nostoc sp. MG11 TaxID=2721166 RepID=UPI0018670855|nr:hypothetical protein [Nostoc sp. MG11]
MKRFTEQQAELAMKFLNQFQFSRQHREFSYRYWKTGGYGWNGCQMGGTYQVKALMWYHFVYKPSSKEWRPSIILTALEKATIMRQN